MQVETLDAITSRTGTSRRGNGGSNMNSDDSFKKNATFEKKWDHIILYIYIKYYICTQKKYVDRKNDGLGADLQADLLGES
jgi:hypothetical protein